MPDWKGSTRRADLPRDWPARVLHVLTRDRHRCQWIRQDNGRCCLLPALDVDHRIPHSEGGTDDYGNLWALCEWHHSKKTGREGGRASGAARRAKRDQAKPMHPGIQAPPDPAPF